MFVLRTLIVGCLLCCAMLAEVTDSSSAAMASPSTSKVASRHRATKRTADKKTPHSICPATGRHRKPRKMRRSCLPKKAQGAPTQPGAGEEGSSRSPSATPAGGGASSDGAGGTGMAPSESSVLEESSPVSESPAPAEPTPPVERTPVEAPPVEASPVEVSPVETPPVETPPVEASVPFRFFSASSFWNEVVPADAPLDPSSAEMVGAFDALIASEEQANDGPWIDTTEYSIPIYTVPANQPTVPVQLIDHPPETALSSAWSAVPLPATATPAAGTDASLVVWQPSTNRLWEFHRLAHESEDWQATWGGAIQNVSSNPGVYGPEAWPNAHSWWGISASSLSLLGGLITLEDLQLHQIHHALEMAIPNVRAGVYTSPAQRSDGKSPNPLSLPEGAHLRLNPNLNLATLHLPPLTLLLAQAAQSYGIFITDTSSIAEFYAQDPTPTNTNPYTGPTGYYENKYPNQILATFPWNQLQLLKMKLHRTHSKHPPRHKAKQKHRRG
jgi:hypothetical protein